MSISLYKKNACYLSVKVFCTKVLIGDTIFTSPTGDGTASLHEWSSQPCEGLAACSAKGVPSILSYLKARGVGPALGIEPATHCSADKHSTNWANSAMLPENRIYILFIVCHCPFANLHGDWIHLSMYPNYPLLTLNWPEWKHAVLFSV